MLLLLSSKPKTRNELCKNAKTPLCDPFRVSGALIHQTCWVSMTSAVVNLPYINFLEGKPHKSIGLTNGNYPGMDHQVLVRGGNAAKKSEAATDPMKRKQLSWQKLTLKQLLSEKQKCVTPGKSWHACVCTDDFRVSCRLKSHLTGCQVCRKGQNTREESVLALVAEGIT